MFKYYGGNILLSFRLVLLQKIFVTSVMKVSVCDSKNRKAAFVKAKLKKTEQKKNLGLSLGWHDAPFPILWERSQAGSADSVPPRFAGTTHWSC